MITADFFEAVLVDPPKALRSAAWNMSLEPSPCTSFCEHCDERAADHFMIQADPMHTDMKEDVDYDVCLWCALGMNGNGGEHLTEAVDFVDILAAEWWFLAFNDGDLPKMPEPDFSGEVLSVRARVILTSGEVAHDEVYPVDATPSATDLLGLISRRFTAWSGVEGIEINGSACMVWACDSGGRENPEASRFALQAICGPAVVFNAEVVA